MGEVFEQILSLEELGTVKLRLVAHIVYDDKLFVVLYQIE